MPGKSLAFYDDAARARRYSRKGGFAAARKERMLDVTLDLLVALTSPQSTILELGAGTGIFTARLLESGHFREIYVTDGAEAMLAVAQETLEPGRTSLHFAQVDFTGDWSSRFAGVGIDAVTSSMALHHAQNKRQLFQQVYDTLEPKGVFCFADHMAGTTVGVEHLIARERALVRLGRDGVGSPEQIAEVMRQDEKVQREEGNLCETVTQYQHYLESSGFQDVDCLWRDYWLAVLVARKPESG